MNFTGTWVLFLAVRTVTFAPGQPAYTLRLSADTPRASRWSIKMERAYLRGSQRFSESTVTILEEKVRPQADRLLWETKIIGYFVNGRSVSPALFPPFVVETDRQGRPVRPILLESPDPERLDDWIEDLANAISLVLPDQPVRPSDRWSYTITVGLRPPSEPRFLKVAYLLKGTDPEDRNDSLLIEMDASAPLKLVWKRPEANWTASGSFQIAARFWLDRSTQLLRKKESRIRFGYTLEREQRSGTEWVQTTTFVNGAITLVGQAAGSPS